MKVTLLPFLLLQCFLLLPNFVLGEHILTGQMSYSYESGNNYSIKLELFRDCASGSAEFDNPAIVSVYAEYVDTISHSTTSYCIFDFSIVQVDIVQDECVELPTPMCVEKATYESQVELPYDPSIISYHIIYQRCCRSSQYTNVHSEGRGMTIWCEVKPAGVYVANTSPLLSSNLFHEVCAGDFFEFEVAVQDDIEGDSISYELWNPLAGGGLVGSSGFPGEVSSCDGVIPDPACPPPFDIIQFIIPYYTYLFPLGAASEIEIDSNSGTINGVAELVGQFMCGLRLKEFREGELISNSYQELTIRVVPESDTSSLTELVHLPISCYPNPVTETLIVEIPVSKEEIQLSILDANGKELKEIKNVIGNTIEVDMNGLHGLYFIRLKTLEKVYSGKIIVL